MYPENCSKIIKISLIILVVIISGFLIYFNITQAAEIRIENNQIIVKNGSYQYVLNIQKKVDNESFWVYGLVIGRYSGADAVYQGNFQLISFSDMPKYRDIFIMLENTFKGKPVAYVYQVSSDKEENISSSGYKGMFASGDGKSEINPLDKVLNSSVNYFFITGENVIKDKIKLIQKSDIIALKGYIANLESIMNNGKKISLSPRMVNAAHFIVEDVEIIDTDSPKFSFPKKEFINPLKNISGIFNSKNTNYKISAIIFAPPNNSEVIINGKKLKEGNFLNEAKIKKINKSSVILEIDGKDIVVTSK